MVSVEDLIDPAATNRQLRALAFFQASLASNSTDAIDCLVPIVLLALKTKDKTQFDVPEVASAVKETFPLLELPLYMVNEIIPKLVSRRALRYDAATHLYIVDVATLTQRLESNTIEFEPGSISRLEVSLQEFARTRNVLSPFASPNWEQALIHFFLAGTEETPRETKNINGALVSHPRSIDNTLIASYLRYCERETPHLFKNAVKLYYAATTYNFFRDLESVGSTSEYKNLAVLYDSTVLMRLLGSSGSLLKLATLQMHVALQGLGCQIYYFDHTFQETQTNLDRVVQNYNLGRPIYPETNEALKAHEVAIGQIATLARNVDSELGKLGITQHQVSYGTSKQLDFHQIDEATFIRDLDTGSTNYDEFTRSRDAHSLALTMRLRGGNSSRDVGKSKAIFVTHNAVFAGSAKRFIIRNKLELPRTAPPVITLGQMTTLSWLAAEKPYVEEQVTKELLANCFRAVLPSERWEEEFWTAISLLRGNNEAEALLQNTVYVDSARRIALADSFGHAALVRKVVDFELLKRAEEDKIREIESAREAARISASADTMLQLEVNAQRHAEMLAKKILKWIKLGICINFVGLFILSFFADRLKHSLWLYPALAVSAFIGVVTGLDYFGFPIPRNFLKPLERLIKKIVLLLRPYHYG